MNSLFSLLSTVFIDGTLQYAIADWVFIATAAAAVLSSLAGGVFGRNSQKKENELNRQHDIDMLERQQAFQVSETDRLNEYNTPSNQLARYQAAGLNPHLMSQNINALGSATMGPQGTSTPGVAPNFDDLKDVGSILNNAPYQIQQQENANQDVETRRIMAQAERDKAQAAMVDASVNVMRQSSDRTLKKAQEDFIRTQQSEYKKNAQSLRDLQIAQSYYYSQAGLERLEKAGLNKAEAHSISEKLKGELNVIQAQAYALWQAGARDQSEAAFTRWWLTGEPKVDGPLKQQLDNAIGEGFSRMYLNLSQAAHVDQMSKNEEHNFGNWFYNTSSNLVPMAASAAVMKRIPAAGSGLVTESSQTVTHGMTPQGRKTSTTTTVSRKRKPK